MSHSVKIYDTCIGCTQCVRVCPIDVLEMMGLRLNHIIFFICSFTANGLSEKRNIVCPKKKKKKKPIILFFFHSKDFFSLVIHSYPEIMNCVRIGILDAAIEIAFLATFSATPPIS